MPAPIGRLRDRVRQAFQQAFQADDKRLRLSITLFAVILCALLGFAVAPRLPAASGTASHAPVAGGGAPPSTEAKGSAEVKMLDGKPRSERCEEQTWPYIDRRCLRVVGDPASPKPDSAPTRTEPTASAAASSAAGNAASAPSGEGARNVALPAQQPTVEARVEPQERGLQGEYSRYPPLYAAPPGSEPGVGVVVPPYWLMERPYETRRYDEPRRQRRARRGGIYRGGLHAPN